MAKRTCKFVDPKTGVKCEGDHKSLGYCLKHYKKLLRYGDPGAHGRRWAHTWEPEIVSTDAFVPLTRGKWAVIDLADLPLVQSRVWQAMPGKRTFYATSSDGPMHRLILGLGPGDRTPDHIDGDGLNNRRANLRLVSLSQNAANRRPIRGGASSFKGVTSARGRWRARLVAKDGSRHHLGYFDTEEAAGAAYDVAALAEWGEYARLNSPPES